MNEANPVDLLFGGMEKLGPGTRADTLKVLAMLPEWPHRLIVDAGAGTGRQTLALVDRIRQPIHAVDSYQPFLVDLVKRARESGVAHLIHTHCMNMADIPNTFREIDLLWSEGAAYNIGFVHALQIWHSAIRRGGFAVVSELSWLRDEAPEEVGQFFKTGYPDMRSVDANCAIAERAGYHLLGTHTLPAEAWTEGYYDVLEPRAEALLRHPDESVRIFAAETIEEIRIFRGSEESYGYVFYVMQTV